MRCLPALCAAAVCLSAAGAELETVVVHASRLGGADQNAVVLTEEDLEAQRAGRAEDALRGLPGLALARSGNVGGLTQARVRGAEANHLLVMLDGIELNNPATGSEVDFAHLSLAGAARVELVNGPQSAVWGERRAGRAAVHRHHTHRRHDTARLGRRQPRHQRGHRPRRPRRPPRPCRRAGQPLRHWRHQHRPGAGTRKMATATPRCT